MGCMCMDCKHNDIVTDNHGDILCICTCCESENFLKKVSIAFGECDFGEVAIEEVEGEE